jgi:DNA-binding transcriptional LysR family regulator
MDLNELAVFIRVAETHSISGAARLLSLPKSTVSRRLSSLEARLSVRLVQRGPREVRLTEAGRMLHERCGRLVTDAEAAARAVTLHGAARGIVRVSVGMDFGTLVVAPIAAEFMRMHPQVDLELLLGNHPVDLVREDIDVAIRIGPVRDTSLVARRLGTTRGVMCAAPAYLARRGEPRAPAELAHHDCVVFASPAHSAQWTFHGPGGPEAVDVRPRLSVNSLCVARDAAMAGLGIARLPLFVCQRELGAGQLQQVLAGYSLEERPVHVVYASARQMPARVRAWLDFLIARSTGIV